MLRIRSSLAVLALLAVTFLAACASAGGGMEGTADTGPTAVTVVVNNNLTIPTSLTVSLVPENGVRRVLGSVSPNGNASLGVRGAITGGRYRLLARTTNGNDLVSDPFSLGDGAQVTWNVQSNIVTVSR